MKYIEKILIKNTLSIFSNIWNKRHLIEFSPIMDIIQGMIIEKIGFIPTLEQIYIYFKKELIVTSGGKNVAPAVLEDRLRAHPLISQCMVVGDNKPFIAALVTLDQDALKSWIVANKKDGATVADLTNDPTLHAVIQTAVDEANKAVSRAESIRKFTILPTDFSIAGGQLTAKLSVKRHVVAQQFAKEIEALFA